MSASPGRKLGSYEIPAPIGAGGLEEAYRAKNPRLIFLNSPDSPESSWSKG